ncbi:MAG TPA: MBL fold metallo-hydrolase [Bryobacteraceae bacterium]|nr:MBL fold metallo-hydrolase [Bryobacteraceae bacterium]
MKALLPLALLLFFAPAADEFPTSGGVVRITPIQHASVVLEAAGKVLYIDPAQGSYDTRPAADLILLTDIHPDHLVPAVIEKLRRPGTAIFGPEAAAKSVSGVTIIRNGETKTWRSWTIEALPMYNLTRGPAPCKLYHEKGRGNGYLLTFGGKRFYFAGDTEGIPEMRALRNIDVAFVPMNLPYTMTPEEAADAVRAFHPRIVYPYHFRGSDLGGFAKALAGSGTEVRIRNWYGN